MTGPAAVPFEAAVVPLTGRPAAGREPPIGLLFVVADGDGLEVAGVAMASVVLVLVLLLVVLSVLAALAVMVLLDVLPLTVTVTTTVLCLWLQAHDEAVCGVVLFVAGVAVQDFDEEEEKEEVEDDVLEVLVVMDWLLEVMGMGMVRLDEVAGAAARRARFAGLSLWMSALSWAALAEMKVRRAKRLKILACIVGI